MLQFVPGKQNSDVDNGSNDACGIANMDVSPNTFDCSNVGANMVTLTITDNNGNTSTCQSTVTIEDHVNPAAICQDITIQLDANGEVSLDANQVDNGSNDACGIATMTVAPNTFDCSNVGANMVTLTITDHNGNSSTCESTVTVEDNVAPIALCQDMTIQLDDLGNASITAEQIDNGSNDACGIATMTVTPNTFDCSNVGANVVTLTITDNNGNITTCESTITVEDNVAAIALCQDITIQLDELGNASITAEQVNNGSNDACGIATMTVSPNTFDCSNIDDNEVILTITDHNGNISTCESIVTVEDNVNPVAVCQDITIQLNADGEVEITALDIDNGSSDACGINNMSITPSEFNCSNVGANIITLTVVDNNGNISTCEAQVTVEDNVAPIALCEDIEIELDEFGQASITAEQVNDDSEDACGIATMTVSPNTFDCSNVGANMVTLTITDNNGNISTCESVVTVVDDIDPTVICQDISINLDENGLASIIPSDIDNGSNDNCSYTLNASQLAFDCSDVGENTVVLIVTDASGNTETCDAIVTVFDVTDPVIACPTDQDLFIGAGCEVLLPNFNSELSVADACGISTIVQTPAPGTIYTQDEAGLHTIEYTVTDVNGNVSICTFDITIIDAEAFSIDGVDSTHVICNGASDGTITITASGAPAGMFYSIDGVDYSNTTGIFTGLAPGSYPISVMNTNDCIHTWPNIIITEPMPLVIDVVHVIDVMGCYGDETGVITVVASGGTPTYYYSINNGDTWQTSNVFSNLPSAVYSVMIKDSHDCTTAWEGDTFVIEPELLALVDIDDVQITSCYGDLSGEIHITATGGTGIISYSIDGGNSWYQNDGDFTNLAAGFYYVQIHDQNGCENGYESPIIITQPVELILTDAVSTDVTVCYGNTNGTINVSAYGGTGTITYSIDSTNSFQNNNGVFENLAAGLYYVFVRDNNGCIIEYENNPLFIDEPVQVTMEVVTVDVTGCVGDNNGSIQIDAIGGTEIYSYSIDGGVSWNTSNIFSDLIAGTYDIATRDDNGCIQDYENNPVIITEPEAIMFYQVNAIPPACAGEGGDIYITAFGGTGVLYYSIDGGENYQTNAHFEGVNGGDYYLMIKDENDCEVIYENNPVILLEPKELMVNEVFTTHITCDGILGTIEIIASGGTGDIVYSIDNGNNYQASNTFSNLSSDTYIIRVMDANGCVKLSAENPVVIREFNAFAMQVQTVDVDGCYGDLTGEIHLDGSGGDGQLSYSIDGGNTWYENDGDFYDLAAGIYDVQLMDENGCTYNPTNSAIINQPDQLIIEDIIIDNDIECYGDNTGLLDISVTGGTGVYKYSIDGGESYFENDGIFIDLIAGTYQIIVKDENDCFVEYENNPVTINQSSLIQVSIITGDNSGCYGHGNGYVSIGAYGGTQAYLYSIDNGETFSTDVNFTGLDAGMYYVLVKDANGCEMEYQYNPVVISQLEGTVINEVVSFDVSCNDLGSIVVTAKGGPTNLMYSIDNGTNYQTNHVFSDLEVGSYNIEVRDVYGCNIIYAHNPVIINGVEPYNVEIQSISGADACVGEEVILVANAVNSQSYTWNTGQTGSSIVVSGTDDGLTDYTCIAVNNEGCIGEKDISIDYHSAPVVDFVVESEEEQFCIYNPVTIEAYSADAITYEWKTDALEGPIVEYAATTSGTIYYQLTATNAWGCSTIDSVAIDFKDCALDFEELIVNLYPNPTSGKFTLSLTGVREDVEIAIYDFIGKEVTQEKLSDMTSYIVEKEFDLTIYEDGVYFIRIIHHDRVYTERVVVQ